MLENQNEELDQINADAQVEDQDAIEDEEFVQGEDVADENDAADEAEAEEDADQAPAAEGEVQGQAEGEHAPLEEMPLQDKIGRMSGLLRRYKKAQAAVDERNGEQLRINERLITMLKVKPKTTKKELGFLLDMSSRSLTELLKEFEAKDIVVIRTSEDDGYETIVELTEKGSTVDGHLGEPVEEIDYFDCLDEDEKAQLADLAVKVAKSLEAKLVEMGEDPNRDDRRDDRRGGFRGGRDDRDRGGRGDFRGGRDDRGGRGGFRGGRDDRDRGGFRGGRDDRGGRGGRGGFRGGRDDRDRGGFRGGRDDRDRGGYRGGRGDDRRGGFRGGRDDRDRGGRGGYGHRDFHDNGKPGFSRAESRKGYNHAGRYSDFDFSKSKKHDDRR